MIRVLVVDDEPLARERIRTLLAAEHDVKVVGECGDGPQAVRTITEVGPDLVFLDVQMPGLDGFGVLQALDREAIPLTIFVTAYDRYALQAFDVSAVDYLLKPFGAKRFARALERARSELERDDGAVTRRLLSLLEGLEPSRRYTRHLVVRASGRVIFLKVEEIDWIEAEGNYIRLHVGSTSHLIRETMKGIESRLDPERFLRIHRSTIVQFDRIRELKPLLHGEYDVILADGTHLTASRGPDSRLKQLVESARG